MVYTRSHIRPYKTVKYCNETITFSSNTNFTEQYEPYGEITHISA